jgi:ectoine hydroxylase-related dioxygenase (phytanoyl-CoA dioxygenase family)
VDEAKFRYNLQTLGYAHFPGVVPAPLLARLSQGIDGAISRARANGHASGNYAYLAQNEGDAFVELLELSPLQSYIDMVLTDTCIISGYSVISNEPGERNPIQTAIHRDHARFSRPYLLTLNLLYLVDDFTKENGATYLLPGSQHAGERPDDEFFYKNAIRVEGKAGDAVIFDSLVWHAGGVNDTAHARRGITKVFVRSYMRTQFDMPRATKPEVAERLSERSRRLLAYNVRMPTSLNEFFLPPEQRLYKPNQG